MLKVFVFQRRHLVFIGLGIVAVILGSVWLFGSSKALETSAKDEAVQVIHMVTGEFKATDENGNTIESYLWHPGTVFANQGSDVELRIFGVNGKSHPFVIEGLDVQGEVKKGEETVVKFKAEQKGVFRIICTTHMEHQNNGPMVGYLIVQ